MVRVNTRRPVVSSVAVVNPCNCETETCAGQTDHGPSDIDDEIDSGDDDTDNDCAETASLHVNYDLDQSNDATDVMRMFSYFAGMRQTNRFCFNILSENIESSTYTDQPSVKSNVNNLTSLNGLEIDISYDAAVVSRMISCICRIMSPDKVDHYTAPHRGYYGRQVHTAAFWCIMSIMLKHPHITVMRLSNSSRNCK